MTKKPKIYEIWWSKEIRKYKDSNKQKVFRPIAISEINDGINEKIILGRYLTTRYKEYYRTPLEKNISNFSKDKEKFSYLDIDAPEIIIPISLLSSFCRKLTNLEIDFISKKIDKDTFLFEVNKREKAKKEEKEKKLFLLKQEVNQKILTKKLNLYLNKIQKIETVLVLKLKKEKNGTKTQLWKLNKTQQQKKLIESTIKRFKIAVDKLIIFYSHPIIYENYIEKNILMLYHYGPISFRKKIFFYYKISGSNDYYEWHDFRHDFRNCNWTKYFLLITIFIFSNLFRSSNLINFWFFLSL